MGDGIWLVRIEDLVRPKQDDKFFVTGVCDVVRPAWDRLYNSRRPGVSIDAERFVAEDVSEPETGLPADDKKLLDFRMVVVTTSNDARERGKVGKLPTVQCFQHLDKPSTMVGV
jgi:hypothetical protein